MVWYSLHESSYGCQASSSFYSILSLLLTSHRKLLGRPTLRTLLAEPLEVSTCSTNLRLHVFCPLASIEYGHADVTILKDDSHVDRLFAGLGETMHGEFPTSQYETFVSFTDSNPGQPT